MFDIDAVQTKEGLIVIRPGNYYSTCETCLSINSKMENEQKINVGYHCFEYERLFDVGCHCAGNSPDRAVRVTFI